MAYREPGTPSMLIVIHKNQMQNLSHIYLPRMEDGMMHRDDQMMSSLEKLVVLRLEVKVIYEAEAIKQHHIYSMKEHKAFHSPKRQKHP